MLAVSYPPRPAAAPLIHMNPGLQMAFALWLCNSMLPVPVKWICVLFPPVVRMHCSSCFCFVHSHVVRHHSDASHDSCERFE